MNIPWVEKYRPKCFDNIILDDFNKIILNNIINKNYFPNMIFYGPPGTGKTTTIINLINVFNKNKYKNSDNNNVIHLNASDDRGIDTIRCLIYNFINCKNMFSENNMKFIILDEVDCITKIAQQALKYIIQSNNKNIRFVLICNYLSKIEQSLSNEFLKIKFNRLPKDKIINFLEIIKENENLNYSKNDLLEIQEYFDSDIRSMINYLQNVTNCKIQLIDNNILENIYNFNIKKYSNKNKEQFINYFYYLSLTYNKDLLEILEMYIKYIIIDKEILNNEFLEISEEILQNTNKDEIIFLNLIYFGLQNIYNP